MLNLNINGSDVQAEEHWTILDAIRSIGIEVPTLCYHKELKPYGACRLCVVEVGPEGKSKLISSCNHPVEEGQIIRTDSASVTKARKILLELYMALCPYSKVIQDLAAKYEVKETRFKKNEKDCLLCGLCVRVCQEVAGPAALGFVGRGSEREVTTPFDEHSAECLGCGACTYLCPTGRMTQEAKAVEEFRNYRGSQRWCRYMRMGLIPYKVCSNSYNCWNCEVDQQMEDMFGTHPIFVAQPAKAKLPTKVADFELMPTLLYFPGHIWIKRLNGVVRVGIDDFAAKIISRVDEITASSVGDIAMQGQAAWEFISYDKKMKMLFPISGKVTDINNDVLNFPPLITDDPYNRGWIYHIKPDILDVELKSLMRINTAMEWMKNEWDKLHHVMGAKKETIIADGGGLVNNLPGMLNQKEWQNVVDTFFLRK